MFRRDHVILSFQNSQTLQFFIFVTFCAFQAVFASMLGPFYTKSRDLNCGLSFPSNSWYWHVGFWKVAILKTENCSIDWEVSDGTGTGRSQSLGSLQQVVDEFLKIDKWKIYWTVNSEVETNNKCFVHSRLWFLWKTWNHWGCPDKEIQDKFKAFFLGVLLTRINFFLWFSSSMSSISSRSMSTSFGNSVCNKNVYQNKTKIISVSTALN